MSVITNTSSPPTIKVYKTGIRLRQFLMLLAQEAVTPRVELETARLRVRLALSELAYDFESLDLLHEFFDGETLNDYLLIWNQDDPRDPPWEIINQVNMLINHLQTEFRAESTDLQSWFCLGSAIADGSGETRYPDDWRPFQGPLSDYALGRARPEREWIWRDRQTVEDLLQRLNLRLNTVFPIEEVFSGPDDLIFTELPFDEFWGWIAIEKGLNSSLPLARTPEWDDPTRTLRWNNRELHTFQSTATNQMRILREFQSHDWQSQVAIPEPELPRHKVSQTVADLNRTIEAAFRDNPEFRLQVDGETVRWLLGTQHCR